MQMKRRVNELVPRNPRQQRNGLGKKMQQQRAGGNALEKEMHFFNFQQPRDRIYGRAVIQSPDERFFARARAGEEEIQNGGTKC